MPKKQVYSPLNAADEESQHEYSQYRDDPNEQHETATGSNSTTMPSSSASIKSALSKKSRKSRRRVDNDELSVPLHALSEGDGGDEHDVESGTAGAGGAAVSLEDDPFYVFREDLTRKLCLVDEGLKRYLNVIHDTVSCCFDGWRTEDKMLSAARSSLFSLHAYWVLFYHLQSNHDQFII